MLGEAPLELRQTSDDRLLGLVTLDLSGGDVCRILQRNGDADILGGTRASGGARDDIAAADFGPQGSDGRSWRSQ